MRSSVAEETKKVEGHHFPISLELSEQEHEDRNNSVSRDNSNSTALDDSYLPSQRAVTLS